MAALAAACVLTTGGCRPAPAPPRHVVWISLDTTRADHLGAFGADPSPTPNLDGLARRSVVFEAATTAATTTLASHFAMFTGTAPHTHGVGENGFIGCAHLDTVAEHAAAAGMATAGFVGSFALDRRFGIAQGFDHWDQHFDVWLTPHHNDQNQRRANAVTDAALDYVDRAGATRIFLFVHYFDAHAAYEPPDHLRRRFDPDADTAPPSLTDLGRAVAERQRAVLGADRGGLAGVRSGLVRALAAPTAPWPAPSTLERRLAALYRGEVAFVDEQAGRLLAGLEEAGILAEALVVVVADHGETFWEHGDAWNHGLGVYQTTARVPMLVSIPGLAPRVVREPVSTIDLAPTVLDALGLAVPARMEGRSLLAAMRGHASEPVPVFVEATHPVAERFHEGVVWRNERKARAVREGDCKLIRTPYLGLEELYDLAADPEERRDLLAARPAEGSTASACDAARLRGLLTDWERRANPMPALVDHEQAREVQERLRALGYLQ